MYILTVAAEWWEIQKNKVVDYPKKGHPIIIAQASWKSQGVLAVDMQRIDIRHAHDITYFVLPVLWESHGIGQLQVTIGWDRKKASHGQAWVFL